jgi:18S rRNA (guanine1575-N7)-methyltransferase
MERLYVSPESYFSEEAAEHYDRSPRMRKVQAELAARSLELLGVGKGRLLDVGCGTGMSMLVAKQAGFDVVGVDISEPMLRIAARKGLKVEKADFTSLPFPDKSFDALISISALQWVWGKSYEDVLAKYRKAASEFHRVLKKGGKAVVQFYPKTEKEFDIVVAAFRRAGFGVRIAIDYPDSPRKTKRYILLSRQH